MPFTKRYPSDILSLILLSSCDSVFSISWIFPIAAFSSAVISPPDSSLSLRYAEKSPVWFRNRIVFSMLTSEPERADNAQTASSPDFTASDKRESLVVFPRATVSFANLISRSFVSSSRV